VRRFIAAFRGRTQVVAKKAAINRRTPKQEKLKMSKIGFSALVGALVFAASSVNAGLPGSGFLVPSLSDSFEDLNWVFNYSGTNGTSSNGKWYGSYRGAPEVLETTASFAGGVAGQSRSLQIRTIDQDGDYTSDQDDFVNTNYSSLWGRYPLRADEPNLLARIYLPDNPGPKDETSFGFRTEAWTDNNVDGYYYPSIWLRHYAGHSKEWEVSVRLGDGYAVDEGLPALDFNSSGGWYSLGLSFDAVGNGHYYLSSGVDPLASADEIYDTTRFNSPNPGGDPLLDHLQYSFLTIGVSKDSNLSADIRVEDMNVYVNTPEPASLFLLAAGGLCFAAFRLLRRLCGRAGR
jgi:hypothetical protein